MGRGEWWGGCDSQLQHHYGKVDNLFLVQIICFCLNALQGDLFNGASICFLFPANSPDLELYPVALVIGAVSRVICMDAV